MSNFADRDDVEALLQIEINTAEQIASVERALKEATAAIQAYCRQYIFKVVNDEYFLDCKGGQKIFLPELPVLEVSSVIEDDEPLTADDDYKLGNFGILYRMGRNWSKGIQNVEITYTHGYDEDHPWWTILNSVCARAAGRAYQAGLKSAENEGVLGVASKSLGDFSVSYASESGGGVGEGIMGVSAARMLLLSEKDALSVFRYKRP